MSDSPATQSQANTIDRDAVRLLDRLHRGAKWRYLWCKFPDESKGTHWLRTARPLSLPAAMTNGDLYFGVHPTAYPKQTNERAKKNDICAINCLFADFDNMTLTDVETMLRERGVPEPSVGVFSGGGIHAYWFLNETLIVNNDNRLRVEQVQAGWVAFVNADGGSKDTAHILRVPGSFNRKPKRAINGVAPRVRVVMERDHEYTFDALAALVDAHKPPRKPAEQREPSTSNDTRYGLRALADELATLRSTPEGGRNVALNKTAFALGGLVAGGELTEAIVISTLEGAARDLGLSDAEARTTINSGLTAGKQEPRTAPKKTQPAPTPPKSATPPAQPRDEDAPHWGDEEEERPQRRVRWEAAELLRAEFSDPVWIVPDLLPAGLSILAGRPKLGKSWLALQTAVAVACGGKVIGRDVQRRKVLYLALEDGERRMQDRLRKLNTPDGAELTVFFEVPRLLDGGLLWLSEELVREKYGFVVIDTLARWSPQRRLEDEAATAGQLGLLQRLLLSSDVGGLIVDHHRKAGAMGAGDVIDDIMGLTAKSGMLDAAMGLYRQRGQKDATLKSVGRDQADAELIITFDPALSCWQLVGNADEVIASRTQQQILDTIEDIFNGAATNKQIADHTGINKGSVSRELAELVARGLLYRKPADAGREVTFHLMGKK